MVYEQRPILLIVSVCISSYLSLLCGVSSGTPRLLFLLSSFPSLPGNDHPDTRWRYLSSSLPTVCPRGSKADKSPTFVGGGNEKGDRSTRDFGCLTLHTPLLQFASRVSYHARSHGTRIWKVDVWGSRSRLTRQSRRVRKVRSRSDLLFFSVQATES